MNTLVPEPEIPSHQGPDAQSVDPELDVITMAVKVPETLAHLHYWVVEMPRAASREEVLQAFGSSSRIAFIDMAEGLSALNVVKEMMADLGRPHDNLYEVALWRDMLKVEGSELFYVQYRGAPEETATAVSRVFLGTQLQCARCHDHPFEHWTQKDFFGMAGFFVRLVVVDAGGGPNNKKYKIGEKSSGDVLFAGSVGRTDFPGSDWETLLASLRALVSRFPADMVVYPGHGPATTLGHELARNPFLEELRAERRDAAR